MAVVRVNFTETNQWNATTGTTMASTAQSITAGNTIVVCIGADANLGTQTVTAVTDTAGNTYTKIISAMDAADKYREEVWYAKNVVAHAANIVTATWSAAVDFRAIVVMQYAGLGANPSVDDAKVNVGTGQPYTTPTLTSNSSESVHIIESRWGFTSSTYPSGFTRFTVAGPGVAEVADKMVTGPFTGTYAITPGNYFALGVILGTGASSGGGTGNPSWRWLRGRTAMERYTQWKPITPSDSVNLAGGVTHAIWVGGAGNVAAVAQDGTVQTFGAVPAGTWLPIGARRINATGTTATALLALYQV